jgi:hypothetical protein
MIDCVSSQEQGFSYCLEKLVIWTVTQRTLELVKGQRGPSCRTGCPSYRPFDLHGRKPLFKGIAQVSKVI